MSLWPPDSGSPDQSGYEGAGATAAGRRSGDAAVPIVALPPGIECEMWQLFRDFFDLAERRRRWRVADDIPWNECNPALKPVIADVVETFCAVELYLPDYSAKILPKVRHSKSRSWFYANWGYEESKHSLVLQEWLMRSGHRTAASGRSQDRGSGSGPQSTGNCARRRRGNGGAGRPRH